jgi:hypothetical protein
VVATVTAELLRRAAAKLRERAEPIKPASTAESWCFEYAHFAIRHVERNVDLDLDPCPDHGHDHGMFGRYSGQYIALMHPPVALALADLLDAHVPLFEGLDPAPDHEVFTLARAILREGT